MIFSSFSRQTILTLVLLLVLAIGGGVAAWRTTTLNKEITRLGQEVTRLSQEGERLTAEVDALRAAEEQSYEPITSPVDTSSWVIEKNDSIDFSFYHPRDSKIINEGNCYRVEYELGFVIFFLPIEGDMRCGARTGVGVLPDNVDVTDYLTIGEKKYEAPGFQVFIDTKGEKSFRPETRYFYDFHHMFDLNKDKNCGDAGRCGRVGYGIYKQVGTPLNEEDVNDTMDTLRVIIQSVNFNIP